MLENCVQLFDGNQYPIVVINEGSNNPGDISLTQIFLGVLSPLIPINLFKGRLRISNELEDLPEIKNYISTNFASTQTCKRVIYEELVSQKEKPNYSDTYLTQAFYLTNISTHNIIEQIRSTMKNKRKPHQIVVLTDGGSSFEIGL